MLPRKSGWQISDNVKRAHIGLLRSDKAPSWLERWVGYLKGCQNFALNLLVEKVFSAKTPPWLSESPYLTPNPPLRDGSSTYWVFKDWQSTLMVEYLKGYQSFVLNLFVEKVIPETKTPMEGWVEQTASAERSRARNIMCSDGATCLLVINVIHQ